MGAVTAAREIAPCPTDTRADTDTECDMDDSPDSNLNERGNMDNHTTIVIDANEYTLTTTANPDIYIPYYVHYDPDTDAFTYFDNPSGAQPDADAPVKRSERGGLGENDQNT